MPNNPSPFQIVMEQITDNPRTFQFSLLMDGEPINPDHYIFAWSFGGDGSSQEASPVHTFSATGDHTVNCEVTPVVVPKPEDDEAGSTTPAPPPPIIVTIPEN